MLALARKNTPAGVKLFQADARSLPFDAHSIDVIVTNPPWATQVGEGTDLYGLCLDSLRESKRVLASGGRMIVLTNQDEYVLRACERLGLSRKKLHQISLHGLVPSVYRVSR